MKWMKWPVALPLCFDDSVTSQDGLDDKREHAPPPEIQNHRLKNSPSKLPSFRFTDAQLGTLSQQRVAGQAEDATQTTEAQESPTTTTTTTRRTSLDELSPRQLRLRTVTISVFSTNNNPTAATTTKANKDRPASDPPRSSPGTGVVNDPPSPCITFQAKPTTTRKPPASRSRNGINLDSRPPLAMTTQKSYSLEAQGRPPSSSNTDAWVANQQTISLPTSSIETKTGAPQQGAQSLAVDERRFSRTKISPIRQFKPSRNSLGSEMPTSRQAVQDNDVTLRALEGFSERTSRHHDVDEQHSDDSDLFLKMAKEEGLARQQDTSRDLNLPTRSNSRRSRIGLEQNRQSMPPSTTYQAPPRVRRRSDQESATGSRIEGGEGMSKALTYQSSTAGRDRPSALDNINQSRYYGGNSRSTPTTPRVFGGSRESREISPESQVPYAGRRPSVPDHTSVLPRSSSYRQSNLSYTSPRTYNSSPLVSRSMDTNETPEAPNVPEGTVSTASTTAASTVWDELEDLKSRIHRLELTGKLPPTSGAAISHASGERPPTATTTVTTMSSSPKRNSGNSNNNPSPAEFAAAAVPEDNHPLLRAALVKSKPLLSAEVYSALEATTQDALSIAAMMGTSGQPGPISSSQTTVNGTGGAPSVSDRQVRRKADSMCRSLTELCLALSEAKIEPAQPNASDTTLRPKSRDDELMQSIEVSPTSQQPSPSNVVRIKNSPRALSRLEARRSSILATSALPSPRYMASEAGTPTQSTMTGRRTSLFLRAPRRAGTEEPQEEEDESRFRTPSRAVTDVNRLRGSPREYASQQALPDTRPPTVQSALPVRRHFISTSLPTVAVLPSPVVPTLGARRFLERSTPERETGNGVSRLAEDRGPRKSSISGGFGLNRVSTLDRRARQTSLEPAPAQPGYH